MAGLGFLVFGFGFWVLGTGFGSSGLGLGALILFKKGEKNVELAWSLQIYIYIYGFES